MNTIIKTTSYEQYAQLGGIINELDHADIISRAKSAVELNKWAVMQAESIALYSGVGQEVLVEATPLYVVMRTDRKPADVEYHHCQMCDQRIFAEALRMIGDVEDLAKIIAAYPSIDF